MGCIITTAEKCCVSLVPSCLCRKLITPLLVDDLVEKKLEKQAACTKENTYVHTNSQILGGLVGEDGKNINPLMFVRPKVVEMWNELEKIQPRTQLHVRGPPGTGKTTVAWAWACFTAQQNNVLWVHVHKFRQRLSSPSTRELACRSIPGYA